MLGRTPRGLLAKASPAPPRGRSGRRRGGWAVRRGSGSGSLAEEELAERSCCANRKECPRGGPGLLLGPLDRESEVRVRRLGKAHFQPAVLVAPAEIGDGLFAHQPPVRQVCRGEDGHLGMMAPPGPPPLHR